jgi:hypothetical protein
MVQIRECTSNQYGTIYELFPPMVYTLRDTTLPNGLEVRYQKKYANWLCKGTDESYLIGKSQPIYDALREKTQADVNLKLGFYTVQGSTILETQPYPRLPTHKLFVHQPGEIWTYESMTPNFSAKDVVVECKHIHVNTDGNGRFIWYMKSITPMRF